MANTINIPPDLRPALGDRFFKIADIASHFNREKDHNNRVYYLHQLRDQARYAIDADLSELKHSTLTTDQKVEALAGHRAAGERILALCDAVTI